MVLGLKRGTVRLYPHNSEWERVAKETINFLNNILGDIVIGIEHIGSTSIKSISAKPIIDIVIGLKDVNTILSYIPILEKNGIIYRGEDVSCQLLFVMGDFENDTRTHHIHIVKYGCTEWENYINFRDYLNDNPQKAQMYDNKKKELSLLYHDDRKAYTLGKQKLIFELLEEGRLWRNNRQ